MTHETDRWIPGQQLTLTVHLRSKVLPKSLLGTAISYALGQWAGMTVYLTAVSLARSGRRHRAGR